MSRARVRPYSGPPSPAATEISTARKAAGLTQKQAAEMIYKATLTWQKWELGKRAMDPALWELWCHKLSAKVALPSSEATQ